MWNNLKKWSCLCWVALILAACSGNVDDSVETVLTLTANKVSILADGKEQVSFKVEQAGVDVTSKAQITCTTTGKALTGNTFATKQVGTYMFEAAYEGAVSEQIKVEATEVVASKYVRKICVMEFTQAHCTQCPAGYRVVADVVENDYDGRAYLLAFHDDTMGEDKLAIKETKQLVSQFKVTTYPYCVTDMRESAKTSYAPLREICNRSFDEYPAHCGVAVKSQYDAASDKATVTVRLTAEKQAKYRLAVYVVEDNVKGFQDDGSIKHPDYNHRHVVRKMLSASINGDDMGEVKAGEEVSKTYEVELAGWKKEDVTFCALVLDESGYVNNINACGVDQESDYELVKN